METEESRKKIAIHFVLPVFAVKTENTTSKCDIFRRVRCRRSTSTWRARWHWAPVASCATAPSNRSCCTPPGSSTLRCPTSSGASRRPTGALSASASGSSRWRPTGWGPIVSSTSSSTWPSDCASARPNIGPSSTGRRSSLAWATCGCRRPRT